MKKITASSLSLLCSLSVLLGSALFLNGALSQPISSGKGLTGFTYTQDHLFISKARGSQVANIHIYGWGSLWPFPEGKDETDGGRVIAKRIQQANRDGQQVMLTCAAAPSNYRKSGTPWNMEERVMDNMENRYAARCAQAVKHWPQITRVQVWNEMKGYWDPSKNRWDYEAYTRFYNKVYTAVKAVKPNVLIGGGYVVLSALNRGFDKPYEGILIDHRAMDAMRYWLKNAIAYDAVCLDGSQAPKDYVKLTHYFRKLAPGKSIWWAEYYSKINLPTDMRHIRQAIAQDQQKGDVSLWWAEKSYPW